MRLSLLAVQSRIRVSQEQGRKQSYSYQTWEAQGSANKSLNLSLKFLGLV